MPDDLNFCPRCGKALVESEDARLSCSCGWALSDPPRLVVAAIVELGEMIVLVRNRSWPETWFGLVAGHLERGVTPEDAIQEKVKEEVGLKGEVLGIVGAYPNIPRNQVVLVFHVRAHGRVVAGPEIAGVKQIRPEEVTITPLVAGRAVRDWLKGAGEQTIRGA